MKFPEDNYYPGYHGFTSGLVYFSRMQFTLESQEETVICNPRTGQNVTLPKLLRDGKTFLGFDPIGKKFKVLFMDQKIPDLHRILTLGNGTMEWRKIKCSCSSLFHHVIGEGICINGILYFSPKKLHFLPCDVKIVCFDVRSEKFKSVDVECARGWYVDLVNYKGKLGVVTWKGRHELSISVLEDVERQEWSKCVYTLPENNIFDSFQYSIAGVTATGEIVLSRNYTSGPFYVFYFSLESNTLRIVEIRGLENDHRVCVYVDLVEDLNVNHAKYLKSRPRLNDVIAIRPKPQERSSAKTSSRQASCRTSSRQSS